MYSWTSRLLEHFSKIQETLHKVDKRSRANTTVVCVTTDPSICIYGLNSDRSGLLSDRVDVKDTNLHSFFFEYKDT